MAAQRIARSFGLNVAAAAAGLAATLFTTWYFGLPEFAFYTINFAKLSLILLGAELIPSSFSIFRLQEDEYFKAAIPTFYVGFALCAATIAAALIISRTIAHSSWFMVLFVFTSSLQRYFDTQAQASGRVDAFFWIPAASNISRLVLLALLSQLPLSIPTILWASVASGGIIGQTVMLYRFPEFLHPGAYRSPISKLLYLWSIRRAYAGYYLNSVLKRLRDTFLPLFCDIAIPSKSEVGRLLVYTRANEAVCGQVRVLEAFMVNRVIRENLQNARKLIFWTIAPLGHAATALISLLLVYRHGIGRQDMILAAFTGLYIYPYILELFWRNDALASFRPRQVTFSLLAFLAGLALPPLIAYALGWISISVMVASYVTGQTLAAMTYRLLPNSKATSDSRRTV